MQDFRQLARDQDHGAAIGGQSIDQRVDLRLGADVHTAGGLVEDQDPAPRGQPLGEHELLLVAAREAGGNHVGAGRAHAQPIEIGLRLQALLARAG